MIQISFLKLPYAINPELAIICKIRKYIESSYYWADNSTIEIIIKELKVNVVVLEYDKKKQIMKIPFPNLKNMEDFNKYVFFYYENNHYELITFSFMSASGNTLKKAIFDNDNTVIIPPIYIIFLLFAVYYIQMNEKDQQEITLFSSFFNIFQESFQKIYNKEAEKEKKKTNFMKKFHTMNPSKERKFLTYFNEYFNLNKNSIVNIKYPFLLELQTASIWKGGAEKEESMLSYYITIELLLHEGETITDKEMSKIKCGQKWDEVRKAYAKFTRKKYVIKPTYNYSNENTPTNKTNSNNRTNNNTNKNKTMKKRK